MDLRKDNLTSTFCAQLIKVDASDAKIKTIETMFLSSKVVEQKMVQNLMPIQIHTKHVFFHFNTVAHHIRSVLQSTQSTLNHGALLRLMLMEVTLKENGESVMNAALQVQLMNKNVVCKIFINHFMLTRRLLVILFNQRIIY